MDLLPRNTFNSKLFIKYDSYVEPLRPEKSVRIFLKIKRRGPPVRDMPRRRIEVIKLLIIASEPVETVI